MPRNASGEYNLPANSLAISGQVASSQNFNDMAQDIETELTGSLARDGTGGMLGNLDMGGFELTNWTQLTDGYGVNLLDYGAIEGADCSTALGLALDAITGADGGTLWIPPGDFLINTQVTKSFAGARYITIRGAGKSSRLLVNNSTGGIALTATARTAVVTLMNLSIEPNIDGAGIGFSYTMDAATSVSKSVFQALDVNMCPQAETESKSFNCGMAITGGIRSPIFHRVHVEPGRDNGVATVIMDSLIRINGCYRPEFYGCRLIDIDAPYGIEYNGQNGEGLVIVHCVVKARTAVSLRKSDQVWLDNVRAATTANVTLSSALENGDPLDGISPNLATGNRILVKNQTAGAENGIYVVQASGAPVRAYDADHRYCLVNATVYVEEGSANAGSAWRCTTAHPIVVGTTSLTFVPDVRVVTMTLANPLVVSWAGHPFVGGEVVSFKTTGTLPTGGGGPAADDIDANDEFFVLSTGLVAGVSFRISTADAGTALRQDGGSQSGVHTGYLEGMSSGQGEAHVHHNQFAGSLNGVVIDGIKQGNFGSNLFYCQQRGTNTTTFYDYKVIGGSGLRFGDDIFRDDDLTTRRHVYLNARPDKDLKDVFIERQVLNADTGTTAPYYIGADVSNVVLVIPEEPMQTDGATYPAVLWERILGASSVRILTENSFTRGSDTSVEADAFQLVRHSLSPEDNNIGIPLGFYFYNDNATPERWRGAALIPVATDVSDGGEIGSLDVYTMAAGTEKKVARFNSSSIQTAPALAIPAAASAVAALSFSTTTTFGIYFGSGDPNAAVTAAKGSLYLRSDGSGVNDRMWVNSDGGTTWKSVVTTA